MLKSMEKLYVATMIEVVAKAINGNLDSVQLNFLSVQNRETEVPLPSLD